MYLCMQSNSHFYSYFFEKNEKISKLKQRNLPYYCRGCWSYLTNTLYPFLSSLFRWFQLYFQWWFLIKRLFSHFTLRSFTNFVLHSKAHLMKKWLERSRLVQTMRIAENYFGFICTALWGSVGVFFLHCGVVLRCGVVTVG